MRPQSERATSSFPGKHDDQVDAAWPGRSVARQNQRRSAAGQKTAKQGSGYSYRPFESDAQLAAWRGNETNDAWVSECVNEADDWSAIDSFKLL